MKNILLDFCLVLLVLMLAGQFLNPDYLKQNNKNQLWIVLIRMSGRAKHCSHPTFRVG